MDSEEKTRVKLAIMGGGGVGKSNITLRFVNGTFEDGYNPTLEDSYVKDNYTLDDEPFPVEILDSAGQDEYVGFRDTYYRDSDGFIFVYSITDRNSFADVDERFESLKRVRESMANPAMPPIVLVANKCDLEDQRVISAHQGQAKAEQFGPSTSFIEASAKSNVNIDQIFATVCKSVKDFKNSQALTDQTKKKKKEKKGGCSIL